MVTQERSREVRSVIDMVSAWAAKHEDVRGVLVVGSWARDAARMDSDVDIVVLTPEYVEPRIWTGLLGGEVIRLRAWGPLKEIRLRRPSGLEVEIGIVPMGWAATNPVDPGTHRVMGDGHCIEYDPAGVLAALSDACRGATGRPADPGLT